MTQQPLPTIDRATLTDIVRLEQSSPDFEVLDWTVSTLSDRSTGNKDGLLRISGHGRDNLGVRPWSVALKIFKKPETDGEPSHLGYWRREIYAYDTGLVAGLPEPVTPARYFGTTMLPG